MILRELFVDDERLQQSSDFRYTPAKDISNIKRSDTRKTRLTLRQVNQLRKASEAHILDQEKELEYIQQIYSAPPAPAA